MFIYISNMCIFYSGVEMLYIRTEEIKANLF